MKVRELIKLIEEDGWKQVRKKGSHRQFRHSTKHGTITVAGKPGADVPTGTLAAILKPAHLKARRYTEIHGHYCKVVVGVRRAFAGPPRLYPCG